MTSRVHRGLTGTLLLALGLVAVPAGPAVAQSVWRDRDHRGSVFIETLFVNYDRRETEFPTWVWFASAHLPTGKRRWVEIEIPYSHFESSNTFLESETFVGNPYFGLEYAFSDGPGVRAKAGVRIPLSLGSGLDAAFNGYYADVERQEAFYTNLATFHTAIHYHRSAVTASNRLGYDVRLTPEALIPTTGQEVELQFGYLGTIQYATSAARLGVGFTGRWFATNPDREFNENSNHQIDVAVDFLSGAVRPGLQLKIPLDSDVNRVEDYVWGVTLTILPRYESP